MAADIRSLTVQHRRDLAGVLDQLTPRQWDHPSLCDGWRVREVVAHVLMPFRTSIPTLLGAIVRARGSFDLAADRLARREASTMSTAELVRVLRDNAEHPWSPPGGGPAGAVSHDVIHGLDVTAALDLPSAASPETVQTVLASFRPKHLRGFGVDLRGVRLVAEDVDFTHGDGREVRLPATEVLLVLTGRQPMPAPEVA